MIRFPVSLAKQADLERRLAKLGITESDFEENFIRGSGAGGQKINKTSSTVQLKHIPSGTEVRCQESRQLAMNRFLARRRICEMLEENVLGLESKKQREISKLRRQKAKRSKRTKEKYLKDKKSRADTKKSRKKVSDY